MMYQLVNKRTEILPLATAHIAYLCNQFNILKALLFIKISQKKDIFAKKKTPIFRALGAPPPDPTLQISGHAPAGKFSCTYTLFNA